MKVAWGLLVLHENAKGNEQTQNALANTESFVEPPDEATTRTTLIELSDEILVEPTHYTKDVNDMHFPVELIDDLQSKGVDTSNFTIAEPVSAPGQRGTLVGTIYGEWSQRDEDGKIVIAWSVEEDYL